MKAILPFLLCLLAAPAFADNQPSTFKFLEPGTEIIIDYKKHASTEFHRREEQEGRLKDWFTRCERAMESGYLKHSDLFKDRNVAYIVKLQSSDIAEIELAQSSGLSSSDTTALQIIKDAAPFSRPPNGTLFRRPVMIALQKDGVHMKIAQ
jgi:hypothetical protein